MESKKINRRKFIQGSAVAAGATVLAACMPVTTISTAADIKASKEAVTPESNNETSIPVASRKLMKVLIVYDSLYGNTQQIAEAIKEGVGSEHEITLTQVSEALLSDLKIIDILFIGSPTHGGSFSDPMKEFLDSIPRHGIPNQISAAFDTGLSIEEMGKIAGMFIDLIGFASPQIAKELGKKDANVIGSETFLVLGTEGPLKDGELERARQWANEIMIRATET